MVDPKELGPFLRWIDKSPVKVAEKTERKKAGATNGFMTIGIGYVDDDDGDDFPPWEDLEDPESNRVLREIARFG